jgi:hypothetical protein
MDATLLLTFAAVAYCGAMVGWYAHKLVVWTRRHLPNHHKESKS